jgi:antitoxin component of MazEF toxin-antitoxin module
MQAIERIITQAHLYKQGASLALVIPAAIRDRLKLQAGQAVTMDYRNGTLRIVIKAQDAERPRS